MPKAGLLAVQPYISRVCIQPWEAPSLWGYWMGTQGQGCTDSPGTGNTGGSGSGLCLVLPLPPSHHYQAPLLAWVHRAADKRMHNSYSPAQEALYAELGAD